LCIQPASRPAVGGVAMGVGVGGLGVGVGVGGVRVGGELEVYASFGFDDICRLAECPMSDGSRSHERKSKIERKKVLHNE